MSPFYALQCISLISLYVFVFVYTFVSCLFFNEWYFVMLYRNSGWECIITTNDKT